MIRAAPSHPLDPCSIRPDATVSDGAHAIAQRYKSLSIFHSHQNSTSWCHTHINNRTRVKTPEDSRHGQRDLQALQLHECCLAR